jgi:D-aminopeptidase
MNRRRFLHTGLGLTGLVLAAGEGLTPVVAGAEKALKARPRLRDLGITIGTMPPGDLNAITDVSGVAVGHATIIRGKGRLRVGEGPVRTGVTAILPHDGELSRNHLYAADFTLNGNGELIGLGPIRRSGLLAAPILFTNTSSVGAVYDAALELMLATDQDLFSRVPRPEPVVGETWADFLNDTAGRHVRASHVEAAIRSARSGAVVEGCVGGGTGMRAYGFKAGIGTASRLAEAGSCVYTVGVIVQANHGRRHQLVVDGVPVGREIPDQMPAAGTPPPGAEAADVESSQGGDGGIGNSLLVAIATDAPLLPIQLQRLCKRATIGMARTGGIATHGSGDLFLAFSTARRLPASSLAGSATDEVEREIEVASDRHISALHQAVVEAVEEAILNALTTADTMTGRDGNTIHAMPLDRLVEVMREHGRLK